MSHWWHDEAIYQIYPRSYQDTNGDGVGDLEGIRRRLPYLADLGVGAVWLSPIFLSPMKDFGYDVQDYRAIDPLFGSMADFDRLLAEAHGHGLKLLLDFVPNHTSDQHEWFKESRQSRSSQRRDWYIWQDPAPDGGPPNNWLSNFGGPAWTFDVATGQYYYHAFLTEQPDLNWRNPAVREAMYDVLRFWLDKGVDGFRVDVIWHLIKDAEFRDNPPNPDWHPGMPEIDKNLQLYSADQPDVHDLIAEMRGVIDAYPERLLIGETYLPIDRLMAYYGRTGEGVHLPFNFQALFTDWTPKALASLIEEYEEALPEDGWPNWVLSNHDKPRIAARVGEAQARVAMMLLLTLRGTPTLYYGDEIGLADVPIPDDRVQDPWTKREGEASEGRDASRTPMQWEEGPRAGFSDTEPWLPLSPDHETRNVAVLKEEDGSLLWLTQALLSLRRQEKALRTGSYRSLAATQEILAFERGDEIGVFLNLTAAPAKIALPARYRGGEVLLTTHRLGGAPALSGEAVTIEAGEGILVRRAG